MRYTKRKGDESTIRRVWSDDKEVLYGIVGTVRDMLAADVLTFCDTDPGVWVFLPAMGILHKTRFAGTREEATSGLPD